MESPKPWNMQITYVYSRRSLAIVKFGFVYQVRYQKRNMKYGKKNFFFGDFLSLYFWLKFLGTLLQLAVKLAVYLKLPLAKGNCKVTINLFSLLQLTDKIKLKIWQCRTIADKTAQLHKFYLTEWHRVASLYLLQMIISFKLEVAILKIR